MTTRTSKAYIKSIDHHSESGKIEIQTLREQLKFTNPKKRLVLKGRLGKNNPNASKYKEASREIHPSPWGPIHFNGYRNIKLADASYCDAYIYDK
jgi:hypothetical protein